jgi:hypothetical protein
MTSDLKLVEQARELERQLRDRGIDPADHHDEDVEAIMEAEHDWLGDGWLGDE